MKLRLFLVPFLAMLLLCCAGSEPAPVKKGETTQPPPKSHPDSVLVVASFENLLHVIPNYSRPQSSDKDRFIREAVTTMCNGGDFIE